MTPVPVAPRKRAPFMFMSLRDVGLFLRSARTDKLVRRTTMKSGSRAAMERVYAELGDPWGSEDPKYRYQTQKYAGIIASLPKGRRFRRALDLGCGLGGLSRALAAHADLVIGVDIAQEAIDRAVPLAAEISNLSFRQLDVLDLPKGLGSDFDLVVVADTFYYLPLPIYDQTLQVVARRVSELLAPNGLCLLADHFFFPGHPEAKLTRRIHQAFASSPSLQHQFTRWRPFYLMEMFERRGVA